MRKFSLLLKYLNKLGIINFIWYTTQRFLLRKKILSIKIPNLPSGVLIRNNPSDHSVFTQIFILEEYNIKIDNEIKTIVDCGANIGLSSLFFLSKYPNATLIAIEPEKNNFNLLRRNLHPIAILTV